MAINGSYRIWTATANGEILDPPDSTNKYPDPSKPAALDIYFGIDPSVPQVPSKERIELHAELEKVLGAVRRLYAPHDSTPSSKFRRYYVRLFRVAQLGLEGDNSPSDIARSALNKVTQDLLDDEAGHIKNGHMMALGRAVVKASIPPLLIYLLLNLVPVQYLGPWLEKLGIVREIASNFMLLWLGCFTGVWLSYGIRTSTVTLADLTTTDADRLVPSIRLLFAGLLTMLLGVLFVLGIVEIKLGSLVVTSIANDATLAFLVGALCGISEATLPSIASKRAAAFIAEIK